MKDSGYPWLGRVPAHWDGRPSMVGQADPIAVIGKGCGIDNVKHYLDKFQFTYTEESAMALLMDIKNWGLKHKRLMTDDEFRAFAEENLKQD